MNKYHVWFESEEQKKSFINHLESELYTDDIIKFVTRLSVGTKYKMECPDDFLAGEFDHAYTKFEGFVTWFNPFIPDDLIDGFFNIEEI